MVHLYLTYCHTQYRMCDLMVVHTFLQVVESPTANTALMHKYVKPPNYILASLIDLLCCCLPLGIVAFIYSLKVRHCDYINQCMYLNIEFMPGFYIKQNCEIACASQGSARMIDISIIFATYIAHAKAFSNYRDGNQL